MRKIIYILIGLMACGAFTCCEVSTSDNGDLDGNWQLLSVNYNRGGAYDSLVDTKNQQIYFAVQFRLMEIKTLGRVFLTDKSAVFFSHLQQSKDTLNIYDMYVHLDVSNDSLLPADTKLFEPIGIRGNEAHFAIQQLDENSMVLHSDFAQLKFRRF